MGALIVVALLVIAAANAAWWWLVDRDRVAHIRELKDRIMTLRLELDAAQKTARIAQIENAQLQDRNAMLTGLVGEKP